MARRLLATAVLASALAAVAAGPVAAEGLEGPEGPEEPGAGRTHSVYLPLAQAPMATAEVAFSVERGFYDTPFRVELTTDAPGASIRFTADGGEPTTVSGIDYTEPVQIYRTTVLRAAAFESGDRRSDVTTHTYIFLRDAVRVTDHTAEAMGLPKTWGEYTEWRLEGQAVNARYGLDQSVVEGHITTIEDDLRSLPTLSVVTSRADMFGSEGIYANPLTEGLEVSGSIEFIDPGGEPAFQEDCGVRIAGGWSRKPDVMLKHSFSLRFRSRYGSPRLEHALFPDSPVESFDVLRLRGSQADSFMYFADKAQYLHDQWARDTQREMGWLSAHGRYVHLYVNGLYWGLYNLAEEPTAAFVSDHLGGDEAHWDVIKDGALREGVWAPAVEDGTMDAYRQMLDIVNGRPQPDPNDPADQARYAHLTSLLNLDQHIDYTLLQIYGANVDWPDKNYRAARNRVIGDGFQLFVWDFEHTTALRDDPSRGFCQTRRDPDTGECGYIADTHGVGALHGWLSHFPDYRVAFGDRVRRHLFDDGALTPARTADRYLALADQIDRAMVGESARWGTGRPEPRAKQDQPAIWNDYAARVGSVPQTHAMWRAERDRLLRDYFPARTEVVLGQLCRRGLSPAVSPPVLAVLPGYKLSMSVGSDGCPDAVRDGTIYYTLDGTDPREPGTGAVAERARRYINPLRPAGFAHVKARVRADTPEGPQWSAIDEVTFGRPRLAVSEVMYHPPDDPEAEFLELTNLEPSHVDLSGVTVTEAVTFTVPAGTVLGPGAFLVIAKDGATFRARYPGVPFAGVYDGKLGNGSEEIVVSDPAGNVLTAVRYRDDGLWPLSPDGRGYSLVNVDPRGDPNDPEGWRASAQVGGSPGRADPTPPHGDGRVVLHEVLANPGAVQEDAIELHNPTGAPVDVGGWYLSDDLDDLQKFRIPGGTVIAPGGFAAFYEDAFAADVDRGFKLSAKGESVFLSSAAPDGSLTGDISGVTFGAADDGVSFGRHRTLNGLSFVALSRPTFGVDDPASVEDFRTGGGAANAHPLVGPVVLNEIMYHPADGGDEFLELHNVTSEPAALHETGRPDGAWQITEGVRFDFPPGAAVPPGGYALVVDTAPAAFREWHGIPPDVPVYGPYDGKLDNGGETVALVRPWPEPGDGAETPPRITVDLVRYDDQPPWPGADGDGPSLERLGATRYGDDPLSWQALTSGGTPGRANTVPRLIFFPVTVKSD